MQAPASDLNNVEGMKLDGIVQLFTGIRLHYSAACFNYIVISFLNLFNYIMISFPIEFETFSRATMLVSS